MMMAFCGVPRLPNGRRRQGHHAGRRVLRRCAGAHKPGHGCGAARWLSQTFREILMPAASKLLRMLAG